MSHVDPLFVDMVITVYVFRYARAERDLKAARPYGEGAVQFYERAEVCSKKILPISVSDRANDNKQHKKFFKFRKILVHVSLNGL